MQDTPPKQAPTEVFSRSSSGLVRAVGTRDLIFYGVMAITVAYVIFIIAAWPNYPGASMELATLLTLVGAVAVAVVYALFASIYPRSGGEYVFLTRTLHPSIGFTLSFVQSVWYAFYFGVNGAFMCIFGLAPLFGVLGVMTGSHALTDIGTWFDGKAGIFIGGSVMVLTIGTLIYRGMAGYFRVQRWGGIVALTSCVLCILILILGDAGVLSFPHHFNALAGPGAYAGVAKKATVSAFSLNSTLNFMIWPAFAIIFSVNMVSFSGEIKNVRRGPMIGMIGSMMVSGLLFIGLMYFGRGALGDRFLLAASSDTAFPLSVSPFLQSMAGILSNSWPIALILSFWIIFMIPYAQGSNILYSSRALLAWSIDGLAPAKFGEVSENRHSPVWAIVIVMTLAEIFLAIFAFTTWVTILSGLLGFALTFFVMSLVAIVFPYWRRDTFEASPAAIRIAGIPLMSVAGLVSLIFVSFLIYRTFVDDAYGANASISLWGNLVAVVLGFAWYFGLRAYRKRQGVPVAERFREIPVE
jgi:amino acid transporter